jgi:hypothetical protein
LTINIDRSRLLAGCGAMAYCGLGIVAEGDRRAPDHGPLVCFILCCCRRPTTRAPMSENG